MALALDADGNMIPVLPGESLGQYQERVARKYANPDPAFTHAHEHMHPRADAHSVTPDWADTTCNPVTTCLDDVCAHCHEHPFGTHHDLIPREDTAVNLNPDEVYQARQEYVAEQKRSARDITASMVGEELRIKNAATGGEKDMKLSQLSAAPAEAMAALGEVYGFGARKYARHNFRKGYAWSLSYDAMLRHIMASLRGEDLDPESGLPHMAHAAWHALTLTQFYFDKQSSMHPAELDDRYVV